jgi:hypothetical protein
MLRRRFTEIESDRHHIMELGKPLKCFLGGRLSEFSADKNSGISSRGILDLFNGLSGQG